MTFRLAIHPAARLAAAFCLFSGVLLSQAPAKAGEPVAVVPKVVIYPGQTIDPGQLREVDVTNPNLRSDYVHSIDALNGMVSKRTLLPGRVIPTGSVREPYAVEKGETVRLVYSDRALTITAPGMPFQNAGLGDFIRVRNIGTGVTVSGTVTGPGTVRVAAR